VSINLNKRIWVYVERLHLHCHGIAEFKAFLLGHEIDYDNPAYSQMGSYNPDWYRFMSREDYHFANFMQSVPSYRYAKVLGETIFDPKIQETAKDNWNYYGEYIRNWLPVVVDLLKLGNFSVDLSAGELTHSEEEEKAEKAPESRDFLGYGFQDMFLDYIRKEINEAYDAGLYLSVMFLSRKLLETLMIRVMEVAFPKISAGSYSAPNHGLWFSTNTNRYLNFDRLIDNLSDNADRFQEDRNSCPSIQR
jgi:hypothetical protein